ncbi:MAG: hypothetical protein ACLTSZ_07535 [Lachnospiraceae bacterium]
MLPPACRHTALPLPKELAESGRLFWRRAVRRVAYRQTTCRLPWLLLFRCVRATHEDYLRPQENGSHYDCDYVTIGNTDVSLDSPQAPYHSHSTPPRFNTAEEGLSKKKHTQV